MKKIILILCLFIPITSCKDYLELVPDNVATINTAFALRNTAERYLTTCYSYLPAHGSLSGNLAFMAGHELWPAPKLTKPAGVSIALGLQSELSPYANEWDGNGFNALRDCNIFLENIGGVPDIEEEERKKWIAEVKVLKAYYHFNLMRMYGPIPIIRENLPVDTETEATKVSRRPVDEVVDYIVELIDESIEDLPLTIEDRNRDLGHFTKPIAATIKADVLTLAASLLFNGNTDYVKLKNHDGTQLISQTYSVQKWERAAKACKEAIDLCHEAELGLYDFGTAEGTTAATLSDLTKTKLSIRNSVTAIEDNNEVIWVNTSSQVSQLSVTPRSWDPNNKKYWLRTNYAPPIKLLDIFYSKNGVPINEDKAYDFDGRYGLKEAGADQNLNIEKDYQTIKLHMDREPRFYASVGVDGGYWYGQGKKGDDNMWLLKTKKGDVAGAIDATNHSFSGYFAKKLIHYESVINTNNYSEVNYPWPVYRMADLYLLYAEAMNEAYGPSEEVYNYINMVRARAGLGTVQQAWTDHADSKYSNKFNDQTGLRDIIQQERMIELVFEGKMYWDLKRWKRAHIELNKTVTGWAVFLPDASEYYNMQLAAQPLFRQRDYLWPISENALLRNKNLVQNTGW